MEAAIRAREGDTYDQADQSHVKDDTGSLVGADRVPELAGTAGLTLRVRLDGLDRGATIALDVAVGRGVAKLVISDIVVGAVAVSSVLGELRSLGGGGLSRHDAREEGRRPKEKGGLAKGWEVVTALHERVG